MIINIARKRIIMILILVMVIDASNFVRFSTMAALNEEI